MFFERTCEIIGELKADKAISDDVATHAMEILSWNTKCAMTVTHSGERYMRMHAVEMDIMLMAL